MSVTQYATNVERIKKMFNSSRSIQCDEDIKIEKQIKFIDLLNLSNKHLLKSETTLII